MATSPTSSVRPGLLVACLLLVLFLKECMAVKFDLPGFHPPAVRCVEHFVANENLVTAVVEIGPGENQNIDIEVFDTSPAHNKYFTRNNAEGTVKFSFTSHDSADVRFCFTNTLKPGFNGEPNLKRSIYLHIDSLAQVPLVDSEKEKEKLQPIEIELRKLEQMLSGVIGDMEYLRNREIQMRDTNEATNERVKWFSILSMLVLVTVGAGQLWYLRQFFRAKKLI
ncbi:emp24/gp25L/p24 family/GOLD-domain-containing protein [Cladochytrium replicatum]|nr:emp24/gp25L/p24 family/GOLD-domain-containing protein [Cladochytrium replicatum]